jgi:hypothetical protein
MAETESADDDNSQPTVLGCIVLIFTLAVIGIIAIPVVRWRDPDGRPLPRMVAIFTPIIAGAMFFGLVTAIMKLFGLSLYTKPEEKGCDEFDVPPKDEEEPG